MKHVSRTAIGLVAAICAAVAGQASAQSFLDGTYVSIGASNNFSKFSMAGINTVGEFDNNDEVDLNLLSGTFAIGKSDIFQLPGGSLRAEVEYTYIDGGDFESASFPGLPSPTFFYQTELDATHAAMLNAWYDFPVPSIDKLVLSAGGGLGVSMLSASTDDTVVTGSASATQFAYMVGLEGNYHVTPRVAVGLGIRYSDYGSLDMPLDGGTSGNLSLDQSALQARATLRFTFGG